MFLDPWNLVSIYVKTVLRRWYISSVCERKIGFEDDPNFDVAVKGENFNMKERGGSLDGVNDNKIMKNDTNAFWKMTHLEEEEGIEGEKLVK